MAMPRLLSLLVIALALGLSACGRKGPLDTPYQAGIEARKEAERRGEPLPPEPAPPNNERPFILDRLI